MNRSLPYSSLIWLLGWNLILVAQEETSPQQASAEASAPEASTAEAPKAWKFTCVLAPVEEATIRLRPEEWSTFEVEKAIPHGSPIRAGEVLVQFDARTYDKKIGDLECELESAQMVLSQARAQQDRLRKTVPIDLAKAERAEQYATDELKLFLTVGKDQNVRTAKFNLKRSRDRLEYEEEELKQLLKMYQEDDLTEETEEIILRRTRDGVAASRFFHEQQALELQQKLEYEIPRKEDELEEAVRRAVLELDRIRILGPADLQKQEIEVQQLARKVERIRQQLERLREDASWLQIKSPLSGTVLYGKHDRGTWEDPTAWMDRLSPGGTCKVGAVLMTVFRERPLRVCTRLAEKDLAALKEGLTGTFACPAVPDMSWTVTLQSVARYPTGNKGYDVEWSVDVPADAPLRPGITGEITVAR